MTDVSVVSIVASAIGAGVVVVVLLQLFALRHSAKLTQLQRLFEQLTIRLDERERQQHDMRDTLTRLLKEQHQEQQQFRTRFDQHQINSLKLLQDSLQKGMTDVRTQLTESLKLNADTIDKRVDKLTQTTDQRLKDISGQVEKRLEKGFEKTTAIFTDVIHRLAKIDSAQKKITELSSNVVSLQEILADKRSRGAFGEVQLSSLIHNMLPEQNFALQHTLSNNKRVDCMLFLPDPTGHVAIDAKFPLENYQALMNCEPIDPARKQLERQFKTDIKKHIEDIASKYIIPGETADGAVMFIPAEAVFAEIHAHYPDLVEYAHKTRVWLVSPTTMMAILTTARAVVKDAATRQQVHIIQEHLVGLSRDFDRFQKRMDDLSRHINLAHHDVEQVHKSSKKITSRFSKIEKVELHPSDLDPDLLEPTTD